MTWLLSQKQKQTVRWKSKRDPTETALGNICKDYYGGHQYSTELTVDKQPTCTEDGSQSYHCERCGDKKDSQVIPAIKHDWGEPEWDWSEDYSSAAVTFTCQNDNTHQETPPVTVTSKVVREATCTIDGEKINTASVTFNGETYTDEQRVTIAAAGHQAGTEWKSDGEKHWKECTECGEKLNEAAHTFEWVTDQEATATEAGSKHEECTVCGYEKAAVEIPATGTPSDTDTPSGDPTSPATGDNSTIALGMAVLLAAGTALTGTVLYNRKKKYSR